MIRSAALSLLLAAALSGCAHDKVQHAAAGAATAAVVTTVTGSRIAGCLGSLVVGVGKEIYDSHAGGHVDALDAVATVSGCSITLAF